MEMTSHDHCDNCVKLYCNAPNVCKMLVCQYGCGVLLHSCKMQDHKNVCQRCKIACINSGYGCPVVLPRGSLRGHLEHCPASVIFCTMEWNRYPVYSKSRLSWVPFFQPNPVLVKGHLDVELAFRDQKVLREVFRRRFKKGKTKVDLMRLRTSAVTNTTQAAPTSSSQPPAVKAESTKMAMALALSSLENKLRKQQLCVNESSGEELENYLSGIGKEESNLSLLDSSSREKIECEVIDDTRTALSGTDRLEIELHSLQTNNSDGKDVPVIDVNSCDSNPIPIPPSHVPMYLDQPLGLNVVVETLPKFQKQFPMYSIPCNQVLRRDEYSGHFKNVHSDIHGGLNGWLEHRCPLAQYGCTFVRYRLLPHSQCGSVVFDQELGSFGVKPCCSATGTCFTSQSSGVNAGQCKAGTSVDLLTSLPLEILEKIAVRLDGFSLCNFSRTCKLLREVCRNALETKGMVLFEWEKRIYDNGNWSWRIRQKRWYFSTSFAPVQRWVHSNVPFMAAHLEKCKHFDHCVPSEQFRYCCIGQTTSPSVTSTNSNYANGTEIGLEYEVGKEGCDVDQIELECQMSDESTEESTSDSDSEILDEVQSTLY